MIRTYRDGELAVLADDRKGGTIRFPMRAGTGVQKIVRNANRIIYFDTESLRYHVEDADGNLLETGDPCPYLGMQVERDGIAVQVKCGCGGDTKDQWYTAHACAIHGRCLPTLVPADLRVWKERKPESDIYHLCHGCESRP